MKVRAAYKWTCRMVEWEFRNKLTEQLMMVGQRDPKTFWAIINKMISWVKDTKDHTDNISSKKWKNYFEELLNDV